MSEMVERVARAMLAELEKSEAGGIVAVHGLREVHFDGELDLMGLARAIISAIRDPTEVMINAAADRDSSGAADAHAWAEAHWKAMIEAAIGEAE